MVYRQAFVRGFNCGAVVAALMIFALIQLAQ